MKGKQTLAIGGATAGGILGVTLLAAFGSQILGQINWASTMFSLATLAGLVMIGYMVVGLTKRMG